MPIPASFKGVSSDCRPWEFVGELFVCRECGHLQKRMDKRWRQEAAAIYDTYDIYHLSDGSEQVKFTRNAAETRSLAILRRFAESVVVPDSGSLLDVGCGKGTLFRAFGTMFPGWKMVGSEQSDKCRAAVQAIDGVTAFHSGPLEQIQGTFELVTLIHVLEHVWDPVSMLHGLRRFLKQGGHMLIQVPNAFESSFDLMVTDHSSHFTLGSLMTLAEKAGLDISLISNEWLAKEITIVLAEPSTRKPAFDASRLDVNAFGTALATIDWLQAVVEDAASVAQPNGVAIFGTAVAGTWLAGMLGESVKFFVDEDPIRSGKRHMAKQVYHPRTVPTSVPIYLALPYPQAWLATRLQQSYPHLKFVAPPSPRFLSEDVNLQQKPLLPEPKAI